MTLMDSSVYLRISILIGRVQQNQYTTGFAVIEQTGLRIGANGTLKNVNVMILNDIFSAVRNIIDITNDLFPDETAVASPDDAPPEETDEGKPDDMNPPQITDAYDGDTEGDDEDDEEEEEEEFKVVIETRDKRKLVLCTCEGVCCGMLQVPPYWAPTTENDDEQMVQSAANGINGTYDENKVNHV